MAVKQVGAAAAGAKEVPAKEDVDKKVTGIGLTTVRVLTTAEFTALTPKDANTLYAQVN